MFLNKAIRTTRIVRTDVFNPSLATQTFLPQTKIFTANAIRSKHSKRQIKRLFQKHPARLRVAARNDTLPKFDPPLDSKYEPFFTPTMILTNGWSKPPSCDNLEVVEKRDELPFGIKRTGNKPNDAVGFLPVYSKFGLGGSKQTTIIRKITGDKEIFVEELKAALSISPDDHRSILWRASGTKIELHGNRTREVKAWLAGLGF